MSSTPKRKLKAALAAWEDQSFTNSPLHASAPITSTRSSSSSSQHTPHGQPANHPLGTSHSLTASNTSTGKSNLAKVNNNSVVASGSGSASGSASKAGNTSIPIPDRGHGIAPTRTGGGGRVMDPFEVRIRFTQHLQHLNASVTSANKAAQYALKYRDMDEDLHSCILEQLERNSMNNRANIMYFIEHLCDMAAREGHQDYVRMMQRDILRVVDAVAPEDGSGAANVKVVRKVLQGLQTKTFLMAQTVSEIEECLKERDTLPDAIGLSSPLQEDVEMAGTRDQTPKVKTNGYARLDKKQIEQRIEEDRERHKRLREHIWAVPLGREDVEFEKFWEETSDFGEDDEILFKEENVERKASTKEFAEEYGARTRGAGD